MNDAFKFIYYKHINQDKWYPMITVFYLTNSCEFRCPYCSNGEAKPYYQLDNKVLPVPEAKKLLDNIRKVCNTLVITGGEPLQYPGFDEIMNHVKSLKFKEVVLTTNGFYFDKYIDSISQAISSLVFSLDSLDDEKADKCFGVGQGTLKKILSNIELAKKNKHAKYSILISSVVTPGGENEIYSVYEYCKKNDFNHAVAPQLIGVKAHEELYSSHEYKQLFQFLAEEKKKGANIFGTVSYLEYMKELKTFRCNPFTMLVISPLGDIFYPCLEIGHFADNLLNTTDLHKVRQEAEKRFGQKPDCGNQCHSACALGFGLALDKTYTYIPEAYHQLKHFVKKK